MKVDEKVDQRLIEAIAKRVISVNEDMGFYGYKTIEAEAMVKDEVKKFENNYGQTES